jgi:TonB family protein
MQKMTFVTPFSCHVNLFFLAVLGFTCLPAFAQDAVSANQASAAVLPSDPRAFMLLAAKTNGLHGDDVRPWHMKATFKTYDEQGNPKDQGAYEEFWNNRKEYKQSYSSAEFSQTEYGTAEGNMRTGSQSNLPSSFGYIQALTYAMANEASISNLDIAAEEQLEMNGASYRCISMKSLQSSPSTKDRIDVTSCFDLGTDILRLTLYPLIQRIDTRSHPVNYQGHFIAGDLEMKHADKLIFSAHLESIEPIMTKDDSFFDPPTDAVPVPTELGADKFTANQGKVTVPSNLGMTLSFRRIHPIYPPIAKVKRVQGDVILQITIGKNGIVDNIDVVSGPSMFRQAAKDAVKRWIFRPALLNGIPVEVETTVSVGFRLAQPS